MTIGGGVAVASRIPFLVLLGLVMALGGVLLWAALLLCSRGHLRFAGGLLITFGCLLFVAGILLFAPQPLWVAVVLNALGVLCVAKAASPQ
jgi:drug/metabolite transporter (DMT)-like permease